MFFIVGSRGLTSQLGSGDFYCPRCDDHSRYDLQGVRRWFTFFFIPIFPISGEERYVECRHCRGSFHEEVLDEAPPAPRREDVDDCLADLDRGATVEATVREMEDLGMTAKEADRAIDNHTQGRVWQCPTCTKHYTEANRPCPKCK